MVSPWTHFFWLSYKKWSRSDFPSFLQWAIFEAFRAAKSNGKLLNSIFTKPLSIKSFFNFDWMFSFIPFSVKLHFSSISWSCASSFTWDGALIKVQEKPRKENHLELSSPWEVKNKTQKGKRKLLCFYFFRFRQKNSVVVARAPPFFWALWASKNL